MSTDTNKFSAGAGAPSVLRAGVAGLLLATIVAFAPAAFAGSAITAYGGYGFGGSFTDATTGQTLLLQDGPSYAVALDLGPDERSQVELFYNHQQTSVQTAPGGPGGGSVGIGINYLHIGGTYFVEEMGPGGYVVGGVGVTYMSPSLNGFGSETLFSMNLGVGYLLPVGKHLGIRFEGRGYATLLQNNGGLFCGSKGCVISISGPAMYQAEGLVGLSLRF